MARRYGSRAVPRPPPHNQNPRARTERQRHLRVLRRRSQVRRPIRRSATTGSGGGAAPSEAARRKPGVSPSRIFILRPVATSLLMAAIMLVGIVAYRFLPLSALPEVDYPTIQVVTLYLGASPDVMTSSGNRPRAML